MDELTTRARVVAEERNHLEVSLQSTHQREVNALKEEHGKMLADLQRKQTEALAHEEFRSKDALASALDRAQRAETEALELQRARQSLTATGESCQQRLLEAEKQVKETTLESSELRKQLKHLEEQKFRHERELTELKVNLASTREQLTVREQHAASQAVQIEEAVNQRRMLEENVSTLKKQVVTLEEKCNLSSQEIAKGNRIIQSLHQASKESKVKLRQRATELAHFEKARLELEKEGQLNRHVLDEKDSELLRGKQREEKLREDKEEMKRKLLEAQDVIKSNQEVIEYLNRQLTDREMKTLPAPTQRFKQTSQRWRPVLCLSCWTRLKAWHQRKHQQVLAMLVMVRYLPWISATSPHLPRHRAPQPPVFHRKRTSCLDLWHIDALRLCPERCLGCLVVFFWESWPMLGATLKKRPSTQELSRFLIRTNFLIGQFFPSELDGFWFLMLDCLQRSLLWE